MSEKHILVADADANTVEEFRQALGQQWMIKSVGTGAAALDELKSRSYDGLVVSLHLPDLEAAQLLNKVRSKYPKTVRFVVAAEQDRAKLVKKVLGAHQFLVRPFKAEGLRAAIERALASDLWVDNDNLHKLVARMRSLPTVPALYLEIVGALKSPDTTTNEVGEIIAKDMAMTTKLLQLINSAYFGLPRTVTSPSEAVGLLGFETVKSMVIAVKLLNQYDRIKMGDFSVESLWNHSTAVAQNARKLVLLQTGDRMLAEEAFTAGLMHDIGKAVLAGNFAEQYVGMQSLARKQNIPPWAVEKDIFGASHGEIGAYLLGLWGLPMGVLEATALHHEPARAVNKTFSALSAVHVANAFQYEADFHVETDAVQAVDMAYLADIEMVDCLPAWREEILGPEARQPGHPAEPKSSASLPSINLASTPPPEATVLPDEEQLAKSSEQASATPEQGDWIPIQIKPTNDPFPKANPVAEPHSDSQQPVPDTLGRPEQRPSFKPELPGAKKAGRSRKDRQLVVGVAAVLGLLVVWLIVGRQTSENQQPLVVRARPANALVETNVAPSVSEPSTQPSDNQPELVKPRPEETNSIAAHETQPSPVSALPSAASSTNSDSASPSNVQPEVRFPKVKLQGILFSPKGPSAIMNGELVRPNDRILGVRIVEIRPDTVTIEFQYQRKTLILDQ